MSPGFTKISVDILKINVLEKPVLWCTFGGSASNTQLFKWVTNVPLELTGREVKQ
jgi:hypothetical protein